MKRVALLLSALPLVGTACSPDQLKVMSYNVLHGQPCGGGGVGELVEARMELAVQGGPGGEPGLVALAPDILGLQEISQVFRRETIAENQACGVLDALPVGGGVPDGVDSIEPFQHQASYLTRRMNGVKFARLVEGGLLTARHPLWGSPYAMRFVRDNPRVLPFIPDVPLPPDDEAAADVAADLANLEIGLAVISRFRIQFPSVHNLSGDASQPGGTRALLHATVRDDWSGRAYDFFDSHLTTTGGNSPPTVAQATDIVNFVQANRRHPETPAFFVCDCNAEPGTLTHQVFTGAGYIDSFAVANPGVDGWTGGRGGLSFDPCDDAADHRIDYVFAIPDDQGRTPAVTASDVVMDYAVEVAPDECLFPSDHNGVISTFDMAVLQ